MYALRTYFLSTLEQVTSYKLLLASCKLQVASYKWHLCQVCTVYIFTVYFSFVIRAEQNIDGRDKKKILLSYFLYSLSKIR